MAKLIIKDKFAVTPNELLHDKNISLRAKGLYGYIQSKPDNWEFSAERIVLENKEGLQSVRSTLIELEKHGYLIRKKSKTETGHWEMEYILLNTKNPADEIPTLGNPTLDCPTLENQHNNKKKEYIKKEYNKKVDNIKLHSVASLPELVKLETGIEPLHYLIAKSYHILFLETKGKMKSLVNAGLKRWTDIVRMLLHNDKVSLEQIIAIKIYLDDCKDEVRGTDKFWIDTIFSINALRKKNIDGVYYFDMIGYRVKKWLREGGNESRVFAAKAKIKNQLEKNGCSVKGV